MKNSKCRIISVALNKGGVGKSTTCINLGVALANQGYRILMVDLDPQGHLAACLGRDAGTLKQTIANLMYTSYGDTAAPPPPPQVDPFAGSGASPDFSDIPDDDGDLPF